MFNTPGAASLGFEEEAVKFASLHRQWLELMRKAGETKNVLLFCFGLEEEALSAKLTRIRQELEQFKKSLSMYLQSMREVQAITTILKPTTTKLS